jgi:general stress protein 26
MSSPEHKEKIWNLIKDIKVGMLTTKYHDEIHSRPVHLVQDEYDGHLWFYTSTDAAKTDEIYQDKNVSISFSDRSSDTYVSLTGTAKIIHNKMLIDRFWGPFVAAWFPEGKDSDKVALLEIHVHAGEHWDTKAPKIVQLYEIFKANMTDSQPDMGENKKFGTLS